jgi:hypothetical protein
MNTVRRVHLGACSLLVLALASGCGSKTTRASGQVLLDGKPLPGGIVTFVPVEGKAPATATIQEDGTFDMPNAPVGPVQVTVNNLALKPGKPEVAEAPRRKGPRGRIPPPAVEQAKRERLGVPQKGEPEKMPGTYVPIPPEYLRIETSGLTLNVQRGGDPHTIELSSK